METGTRRIQLFNIPGYFVSTSQFSNLLHDPIVKEFEYEFAKYVGGQHAVATNSATSALFVLCSYFKNSIQVSIPSIIPEVVPNAIIQAGVGFMFRDWVDWVGSPYEFATAGRKRIIDSAHCVERDQFLHQAKPEWSDINVYSFYPTKLVGSCDGGMIVSNDEFLIEELRQLVYNGWYSLEEKKVIRPGYKMYMSSIQASIAMESFEKLEEKKLELASVREYYNQELGLNNTSEHLYRVRVKDNESFVKKASKQGIVCGIHYHAAHLNPVYKQTSILPQSEQDSKEMVSIPYHEELTLKDVQRVVKFVNENRGF